MKCFHSQLLAIVAVAANANGATIDFEGIAEPSGYVEGSSIVVNGFSFASTQKLFVLSSSLLNVGVNRVNNGTDYLFFDTSSFGSPQSLTISDGFGRPFAVTSFDAVEANRALPGGFTITAEGSLVGGGTVSQTFVTASHPDGELGVFQGFVFSPAFTGLEALVLSASPTTSFSELAIDNLQIANVPEPTPMTLLFVGTAFWLILRFRRRHLSALCHLRW